MLVMSLPESAVPPPSAVAALGTSNLEEIGQLFADEWTSGNSGPEPEVSSYSQKMFPVGPS